MDTGIGGQLRGVVSLIDRLRDIQLEQYIKLPKIVVVGSQSSGKSSLIEQIVGLDFLPRGSGVVTRRPLQIRMTYNQQTPQPEASFQQLPGKKFKDFSHVKNAIEELTDKVCGKDKNIIDQPIILKVVSNSSPNLTVIDLPGMTRIAQGGQVQNIYKVTRDMIGRYMKDPSSIILCVVPANQDITNDEVLGMAMKMDPLGERTLGCITKIDIMDRGTDARSLLLNKGEVPLKLGYIGIKNRSQADIQKNMTVADSLKQQKMFFSKSPIYSSLPPSVLGTSALVNSLTGVLESNITQFLPQLLEQVKQRKHSLQDTIKQYGRPLPKNDSEQMALVWAISSQFLAEFKKSIKGHLTTLKNRQAISKTSHHLNTVIESTLEQQYSTEPTDVTIKKVLFAVTKFEGGSLPGFPSIHSFYYLIDPLIKKLKNPLHHTLNELCQTYTHLVDEVLSQTCRQFPVYRQHLQGRVTGLIETARKRCATFIDQIIECQINYIFTNNEEFFDHLDAPTPEIDKHDPIVVKNPVVAILKKRVLAYYKVVVKNLREVVPKNIKRIMLEVTVQDIQFQIFQASHSDNKLVKSWLKPSAGDYEVRLKKQKQFQTLLKAEQYLLTHPAFAKIRVQDVKRKRAQREKELKAIEEKQAAKKKEKQKQIEESPISNERKAQVPKDSAQKNNGPEAERKPEKGHLFQNIFGVKKDQPKTEDPKREEHKTTHGHHAPTHHPSAHDVAAHHATEPKKEKGGLFDNFFGGSNTSSNTSTKPQPPKDFAKDPQSFKDQYNKKAGEASDKAVDDMFKNQKFQKESKKAVESGTSAAIQHQFGVSEKTGNTLGKGMGWLYGQEATQNIMKDQAKTNLKNQVQMKK